MQLLRPSHKRHRSFFLVLSGISYSGRSQPPRCKGIQTDLWDGPSGEELKFPTNSPGGLRWWCRLKNLPAMQETRVLSLDREDPQRRKWLPTPVFLPGEFHGHRSLGGYDPWVCKESDTTEQLTQQQASIPRHVVGVSHLKADPVAFRRL